MPTEVPLKKEIPHEWRRYFDNLSREVERANQKIAELEQRIAELES